MGASEDQIYNLFHKSLHNFLFTVDTYEFFIPKTDHNFYFSLTLLGSLKIITYRNLD